MQPSEMQAQACLPLDLWGLPTPVMSRQPPASERTIFHFQPFLDYPSCQFLNSTIDTPSGTHLLAALGNRLALAELTLKKNKQNDIHNQAVVSSCSGFHVIISLVLYSSWLQDILILLLLKGGFPNYIPLKVARKMDRHRLQRTGKRSHCFTCGKIILIHYQD